MGAPGRREEDAEHRPPSGVRLHLHDAPVGLDPLEHHEEAEARALAPLLGGEEGLEDPGEDLGLHALAPVGDLDQDPGRRRLPLLGARRPRGVLPGGEPQHPAPGHGVPRVDAEVEHGLVEVRGPAHHAGQPRCRVEHDLDAAVEGLPRQACAVGEHRRDVHRGRLAGGLPGDAEEASREVRAPLRRLLDAPGGLRGLGVEPPPGPEEGGVPEDAAEEVVEVVGDARGQRAHGLEPPGLLQVVGEVRLGGDVLDDPEEVLPARQAPRRDAQAHPPAVPPLRLELPRVGLLPVGEGREGGGDARGLQARRGPRVGQDPGGPLVAEDLREPRVHVEEGALHVAAVDAHGGVPDEGAHLLLAAAEGALEEALLHEDPADGEEALGEADAIEAVRGGGVPVLREVQGEDADLPPPGTRHEDEEAVPRVPRPPVPGEVEVLVGEGGAVEVHAVGDEGDARARVAVGPDAAPLVDAVVDGRARGPALEADPVLLGEVPRAHHGPLGEGQGEESRRVARDARRLLRKEVEEGLRVEDGVEGLDDAEDPPRLLGLGIPLPAPLGGFLPPGRGLPALFRGHGGCSPCGHRVPRGVRSRHSFGGGAAAGATAVTDRSAGGGAGGGAGA